MKYEKYSSTFLITFSIFYFGACAGLWHIGYWSTFDINYLQYIGLSDIIKDFVFPFLTSCGIFIISFVVSSISNYHDRIDKTESLIYGRGRDSKLGLFLNKWLIIIIPLYFTNILLFAVFGGDIKYTILPFIISLPLAVFLTNRLTISKTIINPDIRFNIINFILILPLISFCFSKRQSLDIYKNHSYKIISAIQIKSVQNPDQRTRPLGLKYLGTATNKIFLANKDNSEITILNMDDIAFISYKQNE